MPANSDRLGLLATVCAQPEDDAPRLVYADWLDEHSQPERAEFIRVQCELARTPDPMRCPRCNEPVVPHRVSSTPWLTRCTKCVWSHGDFWESTVEKGRRHEALRRRERELWGTRCLFFCDHDFGGLPWVSRDGCGDNEAIVRFGPDPEPEHDGKVIYARGFPSTITLDAETFLAHADRLLWREGWTMECPKCSGMRRCGQKWNPALGPPRVPGPWIQLPDCDGTRRIPRPFPATAQPISRVVLTSVPHWSVYLRRHRDTPEVAKEGLESKYPGITFELPAAGGEVMERR